MVADPFDRAIREHELGNRDVRLINRDGDEMRKHPIKQYYFGDHSDHAW